MENEIILPDTEISQELSNEQALAEINAKFDEVDRQIDQVNAAMGALTASFEEIEKATASSVKAVENTDSIVKAIETASTQLTLIGFNASIEAKRAGGITGAGFNVIAQEVRTLADKNTKQAGEVDHTLNEIKRAIKNINAQLKSVTDAVEANAASIDSLRAVIKETSAMVHSLK